MPNRECRRSPRFLAFRIWRRQQYSLPVSVECPLLNAHVERTFGLRHLAFGIDDVVIHNLLT
jgi:hypothetical protein